MSNEEKKVKNEENLEDQTPVQASLLGRAHLEQVDLEAALSEDQIDVLDEHLVDEEDLEESGSPNIEPFTPPLAEANDDEINFGREAENSYHLDPASPPIAQSPSNAEQPWGQDQQADSTGYHDVFGVGSLGSALFGNLPSFKKTPEKIREKAADNYQKQQKKLDELIFNAKNKGAEIGASHVGKVQQGYLEQGVAPPVEAMQSAFSLDKDSQRSWMGMQKDLDKIEELSTRMQKTSVQAGFDHESSAQDIESKIMDFHQELSSNLEGITDEKGNSLAERISESTRRVQEILKKILESLASLVGMDGSKGQSQATG